MLKNFLSMSFDNEEEVSIGWLESHVSCSVCSRLYYFEMTKLLWLNRFIPIVFLAGIIGVSV